MLEPAGSNLFLSRAFLRVGGRTLARHQLGVALALECQRVICLTRDLGPDVLELQRDAELAGVQFHVVANGRALSGLVTASDELVVFTEGLLVDPQAALSILDSGPAVLVQPVESGLAAGFERLDLNHAAAGAMRIPGRIVDGLNDLPADCDAPSALTRIALQAGVPMREAPAALREGVRWRLIRDEVEAHAAEPAWIRLHMGARGATTPGDAITRFAVRTLGPALLHAGNGGRNVAVAAAAIALMALGAGWLGFATIALPLWGAAWIIWRAAELLGRIEDDSRNESSGPSAVSRAFSGLLDVGLVLMVVWNDGASATASLLDRTFAPFMLVCLLRLLPRVFDRAWTVWLEDRAVVALILGAAALAGFLGQAVMVFAIVLAIVGIALPTAKPHITSA